MDGNSSTPVCREQSEPRNSQCSGLKAVLTDLVKIGPVTGIEVFKSAGTFDVVAQIPSQQPGNSEVWEANITENWALRTTISSKRD